MKRAVVPIPPANGGDITLACIRGKTTEALRTISRPTEALLACLFSVSTLQPRSLLIKLFVDDFKIYKGVCTLKCFSNLFGIEGIKVGFNPLASYEDLEEKQTDNVFLILIQRKQDWALLRAINKLCGNSNKIIPQQKY